MDNTISGDGGNVSSNTPRSTILLLSTVIILHYVLYIATDNDINIKVHIVYLCYKIIVIVIYHLVWHIP